MTQQTSGKKHRKLKRRLIITIAAVVAAYVILVNFLVSAALVPSFMTRLPAFDRIVADSFEKQVHSKTIKKNADFTRKYMKKFRAQTPTRFLSVKTDDGYRLYATEFYHEQPTHLYALVLHGYTGSREEMFPYATYYYNHDYNTIVPDLRCSGVSEGDYIGMGWTDHFDCVKWIDLILSEDPDAQIVLHGQSMGAATALMMTGETDVSENIKAVISDCSYTDAYSMFGEKIREWFHLPAFPFVDSACICLRLRGGYILKDASALEAVKKSHTPTLFIHGMEDKMISVHMSQDLYDAAACKKELLLVEGAGHAQAAAKDSKTYYRTISAFLKEALDSPAP